PWVMPSSGLWGDIAVNKGRWLNFGKFSYLRVARILRNFARRYRPSPLSASWREAYKWWLDRLCFPALLEDGSPSMIRIFTTLAIFAVLLMSATLIVGLSFGD